MGEGDGGLKGVILAAGLGTRLEDGSGEPSLKPLTQVGDKPIIMRVIAGLERAGCTEIIVVVGFEAERIEEGIRRHHDGPAEIVYAYNAEYRKNNGVSVLAARELVGDVFLLSMSDHLFQPSVMELAGAHTPPEDGATLLVDRKIDTIFDMDDATKVRTNDGHIVAIHKQLDDFDCIDVGLFVCTPALMDAIAAVYAERGDASLSEGVLALAQRGKMTVLDIGDRYWQDVDTPEMWAHAEWILGEY